MKQPQPDVYETWIGKFEFVETTSLEMYNFPVGCSCYLDPIGLVLMMF